MNINKILKRLHDSLGIKQGHPLTREDLEKALEENSAKRTRDSSALDYKERLAQINKALISVGDTPISIPRSGRDHVIGGIMHYNFAHPCKGCRWYSLTKEWKGHTYRTGSGDWDYKSYDEKSGRGSYECRHFCTIDPKEVNISRRSKACRSYDK